MSKIIIYGEFDQLTDQSLNLQTLFTKTTRICQTMIKKQTTSKASNGYTIILYIKVIWVTIEISSTVKDGSDIHSFSSRQRGYFITCPTGKLWISEPPNAPVAMYMFICSCTLILTCMVPYLCQGVDYLTNRLKSNQISTFHVEICSFHSFLISQNLLLS